MLLPSLTIFLGSFLLFQVQPLLGKYLIPLFGGSSSVWAACLLFFQTLLIAGYLYAHGLSRLRRRTLACVHLFLLGISLFFLPLTLPGSLPVTVASPVGTVLLLLAITAGAPCLVLAASAPLVQHLCIQDRRARSPWRLYALSNAGSLLALVSYPFLVEPRLDIDVQAGVWSRAYCVYVILCALCAAVPLRQELAAWRGNRPQGAKSEAGETAAVVPLPKGEVALWFAGAACGSATLLAVTNQVCQQIAAVPFILVLTLAAYLGTYIVSFGSRRAYAPPLRVAYLAVSLFATVIALTAGNGLDFHLQLALFFAALVSTCMICHGELVRRQPDSSRLTFYYLAIAAGGAAGSCSVTLLAPLLFTSYVELPLVAAGGALLFLTGTLQRRDGAKRSYGMAWLGGTVLALLILFTGFYLKVLNTGAVESSRNFYGTLKVVREHDPLGESLDVKHGVTTHGRQYLGAPLRRYPTTYYGPDTGAGLALRFHPHRLAGGPLRAGFIGLGAGTLAVYGEPGDTFRFYEIDPDMIRLARERFTFLGDSRATTQVVAGDARVSLEQEADKGEYQRFDLLVVDAFNNDTIPVHLATREAVSLYLRHLRKDGILLFHISNRLLDLLPVFTAHGRALGFTVAEVATPEEPEAGRYAARWVILTRNGEFLNSREMAGRWNPPAANGVEWTDRFASMWKVIR